MSFPTHIAILALTAAQALSATVKEECVVDYTSPCAEGWAPSLAFDRVCEAPISYQGPCATTLPFVETKEDKHRLESICQIRWSCYRDCSLDYKATCPHFWYPSNGLCVPSIAYHGRCAQPVDLKKMEESEKVLWGDRCGVTWPCKAACKKNYDAKCPEGWEHTGTGRCIAPKSYTGPCFTNADLSFFKEKQKQEFEALCNVTFPCS